jgi:hypothetical protein
MCNIQKTEALEKKAGLTAVELPEPQPIESEMKLYAEMMLKVNKLLGEETEEGAE